MKMIAVFISVAMLISATAYVYAGSSGKGGHSKGVPHGQGKIYDSHGQLQQTWKTQPAGDKNVEFFNKHGQLQYYIKPDGIIMNNHGQKIGEIKSQK